MQPLPRSPPVVWPLPSPTSSSLFVAPRLLPCALAHVAVLQHVWEVVHQVVAHRLRPVFFLGGSTTEAGCRQQHRQHERQRLRPRQRPPPCCGRRRGEWGGRHGVFEWSLGGEPWCRGLVLRLGGEP
eukprot:354569-Chlamydomonas_euryale.AAC.6